MEGYLDEGNRSRKKGRDPLLDIIDNFINVFWFLIAEVVLKKWLGNRNTFVLVQLFSITFKTLIIFNEECIVILQWGEWENFFFRIILLVVLWYYFVVRKFVNIMSLIFFLISDLCFYILISSTSISSKVLTLIFNFHSGYMYDIEGVI